MHTDGYHLDDKLVRKLIDLQFENWAHLTLNRIDSAGTDNVIFRLGSDMYIRMPLIPSASDKLNKELSCIPRLPLLPLKTPEPLAVGSPAENYQSPWAIYRWIEGIEVNRGGINDINVAAETNADFIRVLHGGDISMIPSYGEHNNFRGCPLRKRDEPTRQAILNLSDIYDATELLAFWEKSLTIPSWTEEPVLVHGDIHAGNLLMNNGNISAVIDFGLMGTGDPAVDLIVNWSLLSNGARKRFRDVLGTDDNTWLRGRGWAFSTAMIAHSYYRHSNPFMTGMAKQVISEVLIDFRSKG
ncbi:phosphotransferase [Sphingorhabdus sp. Alg231-15]|uniref:phosphotransferase n=1 Tax=Sphingorhabdus sp. Alg231-15 TaxID=1922222 RepID=UPI000D55E4AF